MRAGCASVSVIGGRRLGSRNDALGQGQSVFKRQGVRAAEKAEAEKVIESKAEVDGHNPGLCLQRSAHVWVSCVVNHVNRGSKL